MLGKDWNKSPVSIFSTSSKNPTIKPIVFFKNNKPTLSRDQNPVPLTPGLKTGGETNDIPETDITEQEQLNLLPIFFLSSALVIIILLGKSSNLMCYFLKFLISVRF